MRIILEGTEAELKNALHAFGVPTKLVYDDGSQFLCGDMCGRGHRQKKADRTFGELRKNLKDIVNEFSAESTAPNKPEALRDFVNRSEINVGFIPNRNTEETKALMKEQAKRRREVYRQARSQDRI